ncbi:hypothetical protein TNIN_246891 [Trichonephila inaurata madagascariensis]|uniref:Uncharacterized protein n=1 Tax=Trichonephila inaurata madagascariensis TaxID=2747483 RepID=A0A8X6XJK9_9ARAC|nr:hypothetical protein TNIN_246891 [Trichonephila inaurata madagascariensis]
MSYLMPSLEPLNPTDVDNPIAKQVSMTSHCNRIYFEITFGMQNLSTLKKLTQSLLKGHDFHFYSKDMSKFLAPCPNSSAWTGIGIPFPLGLRLPRKLISLQRKKRV